MIEKDLESRIVSKFEALNLSGVKVLGMWQSAMAGSVKGVEAGESKASLSVAVGLRQYDSFSSPRAEFTVGYALKVRVEVSPDGSALSTYMAAILGLLSTWQQNVDTMKTDLAVANEFTPAGFRLDGGDVKLDDAVSAWSVAGSFVVRGTIHQQEN